MPTPECRTAAPSLRRNRWPLKLAFLSILMFFPAPELPGGDRFTVGSSAKKRCWLPSCLTHRSYSDPMGFVADCLQVHMPATSVKTNRRRQDRIQAVLPVRVRGTDSSGKSFEILAHTLDLTSNGARLGCDSPPTQRARHADHFLSPAPNGIHGGVDKVAGRKKRIPGWPAGLFAGERRLGHESFHFQHTTSNQRLSDVGNGLNRGTLCAIF